MKKTVIASTCLMFAMIGCAKRPNAIAPATIPTSAYSNMSCSQVSTELASERSKLAALSKSQNQAATADAVGVFLVGVPAGSLTGNDKEGYIAVSKGKVLSLESTIKSKRC